MGVMGYGSLVALNQAVTVKKVYLGYNDAFGVSVCGFVEIVELTGY